MTAKAEVYTIEETARRLRVSVSHIRRSIRRGDIRVLRVGHVLRVPASEIDRLLKPTGKAG